ncbi:MAG: chemotaxis protein CheA [Spirochaetes bacterium]|nr:chemotaxis protein CheA [Spirochaetota bacterium]
MTVEKKKTIQTFVERLNTLLQGYELGDLVKAVDIQDTLSSLYKELQNLPRMEKFAQLAQHLIRVADGLADPEKEPKAVSLLRSVSNDLNAFLSGTLSGKELGARVRAKSGLFRQVLFGQGIQPVPGEEREAKKTEAIAPRQEIPSGGASVPPPSLGYEVGYFDSIVEDEKLLSQFFSEAKDHLEEAQSILVELEYDPTNKELINTIFRNFHTIKGSSAFLGLRNVEELSHAIEDLLALVREGKIFLSKELIDLVFHGMELLRNLLEGMHINDFKPQEMKKSFRIIDIHPYINLMRRVLDQYKYRKIGEILAEEGKITLQDLQKLLRKQTETEKKIGELVVEEKIATTEDVLDALKKQKTQVAKVKRLGYVKVSNEKLNTLIDIVGELVINQSMLKQELLGGATSDRAERNISQLETITTTIKNLVLSMGMTPISEIFTKLRVVARNTAEELGKSVYVEMRGEDTELDRNVIETIYDPLIHIIRNSIDHGIEPAEERQQKGKDKVGKILLAAEHKGSGIEIVIEDDGRGIEADRVKAKAMELGLLKKEEAESISIKDLYAFLFLPGFSTSSSVTTVSGRGVGLDVVKKNLDSIHGRVEIVSEPGKFTRFIIRLPLTLAIIEGFVTRVGENKYVFPFSAIEEIKVIDASEIMASENGSEALIYHRGAHIPVLKAHRVFKEEEKKNGERILSLLFSLDQSKYCVVVDELIGKQEIVIKNLSDTLLQECPYFSGGTIFGDGSIGFVVDMQGFLESLK